MAFVKADCSVFNAAMDRALKQISDYSCRLNISEGRPGKKTAELCLSCVPFHMVIVAETNDARAPSFLQYKRIVP